MIKYIFSIILLINIVLAQDKSYYIPAGFHNPLLQSGQYVASSSFYYNINNVTQGGEGYDYYTQYFNFSGYLGISNDITLQTSLQLSPYQTIREDGGGKDIQELYLKPNLVLSYRMNDSFELYADYSFQNFTRKFGERMITVPDDQVSGIDPDTGQIIYGGVRVIPGQPDYKTVANTIRFGFTYIGQLW